MPSCNHTNASGCGLGTREGAANPHSRCTATDERRRQVRVHPRALCSAATRSPLAGAPAPCCPWLTRVGQVQAAHGAAAEQVDGLDALLCKYGDESNNNHTQSEPQEPRQAAKLQTGVHHATPQPVTAVSWHAPRCATTTLGGSCCWRRAARGPLPALTICAASAGRIAYFNLPECALARVGYTPLCGTAACSTLRKRLD